MHLSLLAVTKRPKFSLGMFRDVKRFLGNSYYYFVTRISNTLTIHEGHILYREAT
jgi:hypothetical protein